MSNAGRNFDAVGFGALNCDHILDLTKLNVGQDSESRSSDDESDELLQAGGSAANTIYGLGRLGLETAFIGAIGNDQDAEILLEDMSMVRTSTELISVKDGKSGLARCVISAGGKRDIRVHPNANRLFTASDLERSMDVLRDQTRLLHLSSFADDEQFDLQSELTKELPDELLVSLSPGSLYVERNIDSLWPLLNRADIAFFNQSELMRLMRSTNEFGIDPIAADYHWPAEKYMSTFPRCRFLAITLGAGNGWTRASYDREENPLGETPLIELESEESQVDVDYKVTSVIYARGRGIIKVRRGNLPAEIVDSTGAGDAYAAGFLYGALRGHNPYSSALIGRLVAERSILAMGARQGLPSEPELLEDLENVDAIPGVGLSSIAIG